MQEFCALITTPRMTSNSYIAALPSVLEDLEYQRRNIQRDADC